MHRFLIERRGAFDWKCCQSGKHFSKKHAGHFVALPYQPENNDIPAEHVPAAFDSLRTMAISRIYLDNFDHITAYWVDLGLKLAQVALSYGADDLHGTIIEEHIFHMAGATSPQLQTETDIHPFKITRQLFLCGVKLRQKNGAKVKNTFAPRVGNMT